MQTSLLRFFADALFPDVQGQGTGGARGRGHARGREQGTGGARGAEGCEDADSAQPSLSLPAPARIVRLVEAVVEWYREQVGGSLKEAKVAPIAAQIVGGFGLDHVSAAILAAAYRRLAVLRHSNLGAVERLLREGANPNEREEDGTTPLAWAAMRSNPATTAQLLAGGADPNLTNELGLGPLALAIASLLYQCLDLLGLLDAAFASFLCCQLQGQRQKLFVVSLDVGVQKRDDFCRHALPSCSGLAKS